MVDVIRILKSINKPTPWESSRSPNTEVISLLSPLPNYELTQVSRKDIGGKIPLRK